MSLIDVTQATRLLNSKDVVALPTETVYGLAANINSDEALTKVFQTKGRPFFDPLIVHVKDLEQALHLAHWDAMSLQIAQHFWPGPLTFVLQKKEAQVSDLITNGGPTVALRCPDHKVFQQVLKELNSPLAAPSANFFGRTSPTCADHVLTEFESKVPVVDGGPCDKGIESTIIEVEPKNKQINILRPGIIEAQSLQNFVDDRNKSFKVSYQKKENTPGALKNHYQPSSPLFLIYGTTEVPKLVLNLMNREINRAPAQWELPDDSKLAARRLYSDLREFSKNNQPAFLLIKEQWQSSELWQGLLDRLQKAAHYELHPQGSRWQLTQ